MGIRNPFALKDGKIIVIEDIPKEKNGLKCDCICPNCKEPFIARMGDIKCHHFAHSGKSCKEINAFMTGMYMLLNEYLSKKNTIYLPPVIVGFTLSAYSYISSHTVEEDTYLLSESINENHEVLVKKGVEKACFDYSEIALSSSGKPEAIVVKKGARSMAIRITPPSTICKIKAASRYKEMSTLEIDLFKCENMFYEKKKEEIYSYLKENKTIYRWIYNTLKSEAYPRIMKRSKAFYDAAQERMRKEKEERRLQIQKQLEFSKKLNSPSRISSEKPIVDKETKYKNGYDEVKDKFTQQDEPIYDSSGKRWIKCEKCGKIKLAEQFCDYGGKNRVNTGECYDCAEIARK